MADNNVAISKVYKCVFFSIKKKDMVHELACLSDAALERQMILANLHLLRFLNSMVKLTHATLDTNRKKIPQAYILYI